MAETITINGHRYGWASLELHIEGVRRTEFTEITYSTKVEPGKVRGTGMRVIGRTRGEIDHEGSITLLKSEAQRIKQSLGDGYMLRSWTATLSYAEYEGEGDPITDTLIGCRITSEENSPKQGTEPATVKWDLHILDVFSDDLNAVTDGPGA